MRKSLTLVTAFMIASISCFASIPANHPKLNEYFSKRFINLVFAGGEYRIDLKEVQSVVFDELGYQSLKYAPMDKGNWGKDTYWIFFRNGTWLVFPPSSNAHGAWDTYHDFLKQNPQFLSVP